MKRQSTLHYFMDIHPLVMPNFDYLVFVGKHGFDLTWFMDMPIQHDLYFDDEGLLLEVAL